jgi:hypothetical protein
MGNINPHNICTWNEQADCENCNIQGVIACKWDKKLLIGFHGIAWPTVFTSIFGMVVVGFLTGMWWPLYSYIFYFFLMFGIFEIRFLCSHCPYYAEEGKILHCLANHGSYKFWSYHPGPMNKFEKFMMYFLIATTFFVFPLSAMGYGITAANIVSSISFAVTLKTFYCTNCVNFSCPLNSVPKPVIDEYLKMNPVMKQAWEKSGWQIE